MKRLYQWIYQTSFALPSVEQELLRLETVAERNAARWFVWRRLFASWTYWAVVAAVIVVMLPLIVFGMSAIVFFTRELPSQFRALEFPAYLLYVAMLTLAFAYGGMLPLRRIMLTALTDYLNTQGIRVCPTCRYDLRGAVTERCPECGNELAAARAPSSRP